VDGKSRISFVETAKNSYVSLLVGINRANYRSIVTRSAMHHVTYLHLPNKKGDIFTPTKAAKIPMLLDPRTTNSVITKKAVRIPMLEHRSTNNFFRLHVN
jgi:hypothetical protein